MTLWITAAESDTAGLMWAPETLLLLSFVIKSDDDYYFLTGRKIVESVAIASPATTPVKAWVVAGPASWLEAAIRLTSSE